MGRYAVEICKEREIEAANAEYITVDAPNMDLAEDAARQAGYTPLWVGEAEDWEAENNADLTYSPDKERYAVARLWLLFNHCWISDYDPGLDIVADGLLLNVFGKDYESHPDYVVAKADHYAVLEEN